MTRRAGRTGAAGFTLLELLVVTAIIGLFAGVAVLSIGVVGDERDLERESLRLRSLLELVREEALMQSRDFGVLFAEDGYRFYIYDYAQSRWVEPMNDRLLAARELEPPLRLDLRVEDRDLLLAAFDSSSSASDADEDENEPEPQVMILSSGEMTPFELSFRRESDGASLTLTGGLDGGFEVEEPENVARR